MLATVQTDDGSNVSCGSCGQHTGDTFHTTQSGYNTDMRSAMLLPVIRTTLASVTPFPLLPRLETRQNILHLQRLKQ